MKTKLFEQGFGKKAVIAAAGLLLMIGVCMAQWGGAGVWTVPSGGLYLNCPANSCSVSGQYLNFPGLSALSQLSANSAGSSANTLVNSGISFPIAANETGHLNCELYFTNGSGGGLELSVNGPGTPADLAAYASINTSSSASAFVNSQGTSWQPTLGSTTSTVTTVQHAHLDAGVANGTTAGTLALQYADVNTTGTTILLNTSWCTFP